MPDFLKLGAVTVEVQHDGAGEQTPERIGTTVRAFSGRLRVCIRNTKRAWEFRTGPLTVAQTGALLGVFGGARQGIIGCTGDAFVNGGAVVNCYVEINDREYIPDGLVEFYTFALSLREV